MVIFVGGLDGGDEMIGDGKCGGAASNYRVGRGKGEEVKSVLSLLVM
jgi:hypothetical protein